MVPDLVADAWVLEGMLAELTNQFNAKAQRSVLEPQLAIICVRVAQFQRDMLEAGHDPQACDYAKSRFPLMPVLLLLWCNRLQRELHMRDILESMPETSIRH